ncbi:MAG TPA: ABC transporter permease, partial [Puia sp.]|nr:ABC transporter permease [Puia sp.]
MFKNYLKTAIRNLGRNKINSAVNIVGLFVGFSAFLLIFLVIQYEQSFDDYHKNKKNIYRVVRIGNNPTNREYRTGVPFPVTATVRADFPQLKNVAAIFSDDDVQISVSGHPGAPARKFKLKTGAFFVEPSFFSMFDFPLSAGDIHHALDNPYKALISREEATRYFGDWKTVIGRPLNVDGLDLIITGILNDPPSNSDFPLKIAISYSTLKDLVGMNNWRNITDNNYCLIQTAESGDSARFNGLFLKFTEKYIQPVNKGYSLALQPLNQIHFDDRYGNFSGRTFSKELIVTLWLIGIFLLVVACVNFVNLTTARALDRAREVGIRKVLGGNRAQLMLQFLGETAVTCALALFASLGIVLLALPFLNELLQVQISAGYLYTSGFILAAAITLASVVVLSGFYPSLVLSGFQSAMVLKGVMNVDAKGTFFRRA